MRRARLWLNLLGLAALSIAGAPIASAADAVVLASGTLQQCLGITPGQTRFAGQTPATASFCQQLPGAQLYDEAGQHYKAGDRAGAAKLATSAAEQGNPLAQLRLAIMYEAGDGVPRDKNSALEWYRRAASAGEPAAQMELGGYYEEGDGVPENWDLAAKLYQASAAQGWHKGQVALGRAYEFGIGVPQDRQQAIAWFAKAGAQGNGQGNYYARWLRDPLNNIGFRSQAEHDLVIGGKLRFALLSGDPSRDRVSQLGATQRLADRTKQATGSVGSAHDVADPRERISSMPERRREQLHQSRG